jgi:basic membrane protein A and related proteins
VIAKRSTVWVAVGASAVLLGSAVAGSAMQRSHATFKAGLVSDVGRFNDKSFNQSALEGLQKAKKDFSASIRPIESRAAGDYIPNLTSLARQKYDITIGVGFLMAKAIAATAKKFPKSNFAIVDNSSVGLPGNPKNVRGLVFSTNENSYLIGYMAAKMVAANASDPQVISAVGGLDIPTVDIFIAGYKAGAKAANPDIQVLVDFSQDFGAQDKCKALDQISRGSQVVFQVAGGCGLGALDAAKEKGKWGVGVDRDQAFLGPHILTSAVKRVDVSVYDTIKDVKNGKFKGGDKSYTLKNNGVALGAISPKVPAALKAEVNALKAKIIAGKIKVPTKL